MIKLVEGTRYGRFYDIGDGIYVPSVTTVTRYGCPTPNFLLKYIINNAKGDYDKYLESKALGERFWDEIRDQD